MSSPDDLSKILDVLRTPSPFGEDGPNAMETLAIAAHSVGTKFKHVVVPLRGVNGNTLVIVGTVKKALQRAGANSTELALFVGDALSGDYEHMWKTVLEWVSISDEANKPRADAWDGLLDAVRRNED
jgi:hypothetical protein